MKRFLSLSIAALVLCLVLVPVTDIPAAATVTTCDIAVLEVGHYAYWAADDFSQLDVPPGVEAYTWTTISDAELTASGLAPYDVLIVPWHHDYTWLDGSKAGAIVAWVDSGGRLIVNNYLFAQPLNNDPLMGAFGSAYNVDWTGENGIYSGDSVQIVDPANPLATTPNLLSVTGLSNWARTVHNSVNPATAGSAWMWAMSSVDTGWYWLGYALSGSGVIVLCGGDPEYHSPSYPEATKLIENEIICTLAAGVVITISATEPIIPRESRVENGRVLYESTLTITATDTSTDAPVAGLSIQVQSDRPQDTVIQPTEPTNDKGVTKARIQTREKGTATITGTTSDIDAASVPTTIEFDNANYEQSFRVTVYIIADENDFRGPTVTDPCGLTGTYYRTFLYSNRGVLMQGTGRTRDGAYIQIDWMAGGPRGVNTCFRVVPFPTTASGEPLQEGVTIAVDPAIIPLGSDVYIEGVGTRTAQDTGGGIRGYHIDLYVGAGQAAAAGWANPHLSVRYLDP